MKVTVTPTVVESKKVFEVGNIVIGKDGLVVIITDTHKDEFSGVVINALSSDDRQVGYHSKVWAKSAFTQFHGTITIEL